MSNQRDRTNRDACLKTVLYYLRIKDRDFNTRRKYRYYSKMFRAWPVWGADDPRIAAVYAEAQRKGLTVDHIVPLSSPTVCGLHVYANLQLMGREQNELKSNRWWPYCPHENCELFSVEFEPYQMRLV